MRVACVAAGLMVLSGCQFVRLNHRWQSTQSATASPGTLPVAHPAAVAERAQFEATARHRIVDSGDFNTGGAHPATTLVAGAFDLPVGPHASIGPFLEWTPDFGLTGPQQRIGVQTGMNVRGLLFPDQPIRGVLQGGLGAQSVPFARTGTLATQEGVEGEPIPEDNPWTEADLSERALRLIPLLRLSLSAHVGERWTFGGGLGASTLAGIQRLSVGEGTCDDRCFGERPRPGLAVIGETFAVGTAPVWEGMLALKLGVGVAAGRTRASAPISGSLALTVPFGQPDR